MGLYNKVNEYIAKNIVLFIVLVLLLVSIFKSGKNHDFQGNGTGGYLKTVATSRYAKTSNNVALLGVDGVNSMTAGAADKKIVKNFNINIVVDDIEKSRQNLDTLLQKYGGYVVNFYSYEYDNSKAMNFTIKIPTENLVKCMEQIKNNAYVKSESFSAVDLTDQYTDNENRLKNLYARRDKLRNMMNKQADKLADVLAVDKELDKVQNDIELLEKRNVKIQNDVDYSQINLTIEPKIIENKTIEGWSFKKTFNDAINILIITCQMIIHYFLVFIVFVPLMIVVFVIAVLIKKIVKRCIKQ